MTKTADSKTSTIVDLFQDELRISDVEPESDFFFLGGDSLMAENLVLRINQAFGISLQTSILLEAPTPVELAAVVENSTSSVDRSSLVVPVVGCAGTEPLPMVHGLTGSALFANRFGPSIKAAFQVMALRGKGLEPGEEAPLTSEEFTSVYLEAVRSFHGSYPRVLGGICMGSLIAFEMGRIIHKETGVRPRIVVIDPPPLSYVSLRPMPKGRQEEHNESVLDMKIKFWRVLRDFYALVGLGDSSAGHAARRRAFKQAFTKATISFVPEPYPCDVLMIASSQWASETLDDYKNWGNEDSTIEAIKFPGTHDGFREANIEEIDAKILSFLNG